jgi:hypothetical protein
VIQEYYSKGKDTKVRCVDISSQKGDLLSNRGKNRRRKNLGLDRHGDWQNQFSPVIILFVSLFAFFILVD